jgi:hypothetical protein
MSASEPSNHAGRRRRVSRDLTLASILGVVGVAFGTFSWRRKALPRETRGSIGEALRGAGEFFRSLLRHGSDIFTILEADGTIRYESPSIKCVLGY